MSQTQNQSRRAFLKTAAALAGTAAGIVPCARSHARISGANDRVRVGVVGCGVHARSALLPAFQAAARELNFELVALSDIWRPRRQEGAAFLHALTGSRPALCRNNDELYETRDLDAVIIASADFQHALHTVEALRAGCHVYVETPLAQSQDDARAVRETAKESGKVVQVGTQRRSCPRLARIRESFRSGELGELTLVKMDAGSSPSALSSSPFPAAEVRREDVDWTRFLAGRESGEWDSRKFLAPGRFASLSAGLPAGALVHLIDALHFITQCGAPAAALAGGGIYQPTADSRTNEDAVTAVLEYGAPGQASDPLRVICSARESHVPRTPTELYFSCDGRVLDLRRECGWEGAQPAPDEATRAHMRNWMESIRNGQRPNADIQSGFDHALAVSLITESLRTGRRATRAQDATRFAPIA